MTNRAVSPSETTSATAVWPLVLDAELCDMAWPAAAGERLAGLTRLVGRTVDRALLHRVAEAVAQRFLEAVGRELGT
jgi:hypothetical protein